MLYHLQHENSRLQAENEELRHENAELRRKLRELSEPCEGCGEKVEGWKPMFGSFAPEWWDTLRRRGIDPATGHKTNCSRRPR